MTASLAYLDDKGNPRIRHSITAFVDILGFSDRVLSTENVDEAQAILELILAAIRNSRESVRRVISADQTESSDRWAFKFFSDNLLVGHPCDQNEISIAKAAAFVIRSVQIYQLQMAISEFFVRGALTVGDICLAEDLIFGEALIESYRLESKASFAPRVILSDQLSRQLRSVWMGPSESICQEKANALCRDIDGIWFVNYLQAAVGLEGVDWKLIKEHKTALLASLSGSSRHEVLAKFGWVRRYHNMFCSWHRTDAGYSDEFRIDRIDEESRIRRLGDTR